MSKSYYSVMLVLLLGVFASSDALALQYYNGGGWTRCPLSGSFTGLVVECIRLSVDTVTTQFLAAFSEIMVPIIAAMLSLSMLLYGVQILMGEPEIFKVGLKMLIRNGAVMWFAVNLGGFAPLVMESVTYLLGIVTDSINNVGIVFSCPISASSVIAGLISSATGTSLIWNRLDCIIEKLFGVGAGTAITASMFGMIYSLIFAGTFGVAAFALGMSTLLSLMFFVFRVVYGFILSYLYVGFLIAISPLMVPMLIFPNITGSMFDKWWKSLLSAVMMPAMLMAYLAIAVTIIDAALFTSNVALGKVITDDQIIKAYRKKQQFCQWQTAADRSTFKNHVPEGQAPQDYITGQQKNFLVPMLSGAFDMCEYFDAPTLDFARNGRTHTQVLLDITLGLFIAYIVIGMVVGMFSAFSSVITGIFGAGGSLSSALSAPMVGEKQVKSMAMKGVAGMKGISGKASEVGNMVRGAIGR